VHKIQLTKTPNDERIATQQVLHMAPVPVTKKEELFRVQVLIG